LIFLFCLVISYNLWCHSCLMFISYSCSSPCSRLPFLLILDVVICPLLQCCYLSSCLSAYWMLLFILLLAGTTCPPLMLLLLCCRHIKCWKNFFTNIYFHSFKNLFLGSFLN
jgi:hypothetical protein